MVLIYQLQKKVLGFIGIGAMPSLRFSATSSISPSATTSISPSATTQWARRASRRPKLIPGVPPLAKLSTSFEQLQWLDHSEPESPSKDYDDDDDGEEDNDDDDHGDEEEEEDNDDCHDDGVHLHCVGYVSVCSFEDKVLAWNFIRLILVAANHNFNFCFFCLLQCQLLSISTLVEISQYQCFLIFNANIISNMNINT